ncbi:hypothetical protein SAMN05443247_01858 [Bradyrhizobium erythrophlei]|jgi:hypothetical protein|nr:hypothetical protein SAMN05443247_01858 [Bradyrhizobium erythrophlei]
MAEFFPRLSLEPCLEVFPGTQENAKTTTEKTTEEATHVETWTRDDRSVEQPG